MLALQLNINWVSKKKKTRKITDLHGWMKKQIHPTPCENAVRVSFVYISQRNDKENLLS